MITLGLVTGKKTGRWRLGYGGKGFATVAVGFVLHFGVFIFLKERLVVRLSKGLQNRWVADKLPEGCVRGACGSLSETGKLTDGMGCFRKCSLFLGGAD